MPAFVSTLCICFVFVPMFFLTGVAHYLFVPLAEAVVFAMLASYVISRTLVPTLVMWFYRNVQHYPKEGEHHADSVAGWKRPFVAIQDTFENGFERCRNGYRTLLGAVLHHRMGFATLFLAFCLGTMLLVPQLGQDFFPSVDAGHLRLHLRARSGTRIEETAKLVDQVESAIRNEIPPEEINGILDNIGVPASSINLTYNDSGLIGTGDAASAPLRPSTTLPTTGSAR